MPINYDYVSGFLSTEIIYTKFLLGRHANFLLISEFLLWYKQDSMLVLFLCTAIKMMWKWKDYPIVNIIFPFFQNINTLQWNFSEVLNTNAAKLYKTVWRKLG